MSLSAKLLRVALLSAALLCVAQSLQACPTCSAAVQEGDQGQSLAAGFQYSILLMMALPFVILGSLGSFFYVQILQAQAANAEASEAERD